MSRTNYAFAAPLILAMASANPAWAASSMATSPAGDSQQLVASASIDIRIVIPRIARLPDLLGPISDSDKRNHGMIRTEEKRDGRTIVTVSTP